MSSNQQTRLSKCVSYLQQRQLYECANAIQKAAGQVNCYQNNQSRGRTFSQLVNSKLCEALLVMHCDPHCDTRNIQHVRTLIENYREINGMPSHNYDLPEVPVHAPMAIEVEYADDDDDYDRYEDAGLDYEDHCDDYDCEEYYEEDGPMQYDIEEVDDESVEDCIKDMVDRGGYLSYEQICDEMAECEEDETQIMDALKELVRQGYFEVTSRNPYTGQIDMVLKIR